MNRNKLKTYAPQARRDFIQAVTQQAAHYGLTAKKTEPMTEKGDVVVVAGQAFSKAIAEKRKKLEVRIKKGGYERTMEAMAYTWFNRLVAIRFMELHGYLEHGFRVLSHPAGGSQPEIVAHAQHVDLPGLDQQKVLALKLDGTKEEELYRLVLIAQCNALHKALPFLFEKIDDETELLLPDKLLHSDSLVRKLVNEIDEEDWQPVEIIGWLYQFYISERKEEVIGKVVASEDIPAATQLFTPNWIVKYLVQNTLGRQWLATYPQSALRQKMEYYIEPAEQVPEIQEQLKAVTPISLNPEELTLLDPACGSGHILVEAYDLLKAIYEERGYRAKDTPTLILTKNLFGLEIDDRAAQLAAFALMMKARVDDRRIFDGNVKPNIVAIQDSKSLIAGDVTHALNSPINKEDVPKEYLFEEIQEEKDGLFSQKALAEKGHVAQGDIAYLLELFENAKTFGSLIQIPPKLAAKLPEIEKRLDDVLRFGDLTHASAHVLKPLLQQAQLLARHYHAVVANPPYMDRFDKEFRQFAKDTYPLSKANTYSMFIERGLLSAASFGQVGLVTLQGWMFLSSYDDLRKHFASSFTTTSMAHLGPRAFDAIGGEVVSTTAFTLWKGRVGAFRPVYLRLVAGQSETEKIDLFRQVLEGRRPDLVFQRTEDELAKIPGTPIAYWAGDGLIAAFEAFPSLGERTDPRSGMATGDNSRFLRLWSEVAQSALGLHCESRQEAKESLRSWFPYNKGGAIRKWYGNNDFIVLFYDDGYLIKETKRQKLAAGLITANNSKCWNQECYFLPCVTWSALSNTISVRHCEPGFIFDTKGQCLFTSNRRDLAFYSALLNSKAASAFLEVLTPTLDFNSGYLRRIPDCRPKATEYERVLKIETECRLAAKEDWDDQETSWDFLSLPVLRYRSKDLKTSQEAADAACVTRRTRMKELEEENNRLFIAAYGLQDELSPEVLDGQITLYRPDREDDIKRLLSYAIGCMMGRYSLDKPGLIYAQSGNQGFDSSQYKTFRADDDGIIPLTELNWFPDDVASRFEQFVATTWPTDNREESLKLVADSLDPKKGEPPRETIRRYLAADFYKHHLSMYKKRPIYWLFSSGKQRGFQALVYLHRYNEGTLARMRTEYVVPLIAKMTARLGHLADDIAAASSTPQKKRLETEKATITKQLAEVQTFEEKLRHCADQRIKVDLDDGVKVNYGKFSDPKFGDILTEVRAITGGAPMSEDVKRSEKHKQARNSLPEELVPVFDQFVEDYKFAATIHHGQPFVSHVVLAEMVKAGWRCTGEPIGQWTKARE